MCVNYGKDDVPVRLSQYEVHVKYNNITLTAYAPIIRLKKIMRLAIKVYTGYHVIYYLKFINVDEKSLI
jgi:hypothetical protein